MSEPTPEDLWAYLPNSSLYEAAGVPSWLDQLDLSPAPPHMKMGTHALDIRNCFEFDQFRDTEVALRNRLLDEKHTIVFAARDNADHASEETLEIIRSWLASKDIAPRPGGSHLHPLEAAGRNVQEDLCLMVHRDGDWHLDAAVLCFPSVWSLQEKFALPTRRVHEGVPHYHDELSPKVDRFFDRLRAGQAVWRRNLSIKPYPLLFLPVKKAVQPIGQSVVQNDGSPFWLRTERQTLQVLPKSEAILFTIKLQLAPAKVLLQRPDRAAALLAMYRSWDADMSGFKMAANSLELGFLQWLEVVANDAEREIE